MKNSSIKLKIFVAAILLFALVFSFATLKGGFTVPSGFLGTVLTPIQKVISLTTDKVQGFFGYFYKYNALEAENEQLKMRISELETLERKYNTAIDENAHLRSLARISIENPTYNYEFAAVTAINIGDYHKTITIDKGTNYGLSLYDCVIVREGLVGYISKIGYNFAEVITIIDPSVNVGAIVSQTQEIAVAKGMAEGEGKGAMRLSYLDNDTKSQERNVVETSGYGDIYPKGLVIGYINEVKPEEHGLSSYANLSTAVDFKKLRKVYVITSFSK